MVNLIPRLFWIVVLSVLWSILKLASWTLQAAIGLFVVVAAMAALPLAAILMLVLFLLALVEVGREEIAEP